MTRSIQRRQSVHATTRVQSANPAPCLTGGDGEAWVVHAATESRACTGDCTTFAVSQTWCAAPTSIRASDFPAFGAVAHSPAKLRVKVANAVVLCALGLGSPRFKVDEAVG